MRSCVIRPALGALLAWVTAIAVLPASAVAQSSVAGDAPRAISQSGRVSVHGCVVQPADIEITATPMAAVGAPRPPADRTPPGGPDPTSLPAHRAQVRPTTDPNVFDYVIRGLKANTLHQLDIRIPEGACASTTWVGPARGTFFPGVVGSLDLNGYVLTTRVDVQSTATDGQVIYRAADALTPTDDVRRFRWVSDVAGATGVELQIALDRFTPDRETADTCGTPRGLVWRRRLSSTTGINVSPAIDFGSLMLNEGDGSSGGGTSDGPPVGGVTGSGEQVAGISLATREALERGMPFYVRVVPLDGDGRRLCDRLRQGVPAHAAVSFSRAYTSSLTESGSLLVSGRYAPPQRATTYQFCATTVRPFGPVPRPPFGSFSNDYLFWAMFSDAGLVDGGGVIPQGTSYCWNAQSRSIIDEVGDFFSGAFDALASLVDFVADLYNSIKSEVVSLAASAVDFVGLPCGDPSFCRDALDAALTTALAAAGLPPSLPDVDALLDEGVDYVAGYVRQKVVEAAPGVAGQLAGEGAKALVGAFADEVRRTRGGDGGLPSWLQADNLFRPASLRLDVVRNPLSSTLPPNTLRVNGPAGLFQQMELPIAAGQDTFRVTMTLPPDLSGIAPPCITSPIFNGCLELPEADQLRFRLLQWDNERVVGRCGALTVSAARLAGLFGSTERLYTHSFFMDAAKNLPSDDSSACTPQ